MALIKQDNKQRFIIAGRTRIREPRITASSCTLFGFGCRMVTTSGLEPDDRNIAVHWLTLVSRDQSPLAPYKGRPCIPLEDIPPRLYHRTVEDAAFAILADRLIAGFGDSAKLANAVLPNPGRSTEERTMGVGSQGSMAYGALATAVSSMTDSLLAFSWLGAVYCHRVCRDHWVGLSTELPCC